MSRDSANPSADHLMQTHARDHQPMGLAMGSLALLLAIFWGGNAVATKEAADVIPPLAMGAFRFVFATLFLIGILAWQRIPMWLQRGEWGTSLLMGIMLFLQIWTFNIGVHWSNASHGTVLINTFIFWVAAIEHFYTKSIKLKWWQAVTLGVAAVGVLLCVSTAPVDTATDNLDEPSLVGDLVMALSALILGIKVVYTRFAVQRVPSHRLILWHNAIGALIFLVISLLIEDWSLWISLKTTLSNTTDTPATIVGLTPFLNQMTFAAWFGLLYSGLIVSGFCFAMHAWLLRAHSASHVSVFSFVTPICGVVLAVLRRGDPLSIWLLIAGVCVALAIVLLNWPSANESEAVAIDSELGQM